MTSLEQLTSTPLFGVAATVIFYAAAQLLNRKWNWLHPLFLTAGGLIVLLVLCGIPYEEYKGGGDIVGFFLGPATVALAVPLYESLKRLRGKIRAVVIGVTIGSLCGIVSVAVLTWALGATKDTVLSMLPKSATSPIAIELSRQLGGSPELGGVFAVLTGLLGSMLGPALLRFARVRGDIGIGTAVGTAAHGIGTARLLRDSETQGGISGFAMSLSSIITPILCIPIYWLT
ncbi:LrgB family protein [Cohnella endophytica]|uniref:LrgB family protein n=1 Tax=Cohnella endophytica TaxID=2419778 RepID=A0A494XQT1_9BACL|nr:LrgB family protein [Cohnella endophytica]RKP52985.1 LrgB family protein [Cohnella endophytica]